MQNGDCRMQIGGFSMRESDAGWPVLETANSHEWTPSEKKEGRIELAIFLGVKIVNAVTCKREKNDCRDLQKKSLQFTGRAGRCKHECHEARENCVRRTCARSECVFM